MTPAIGTFVRPVGRRPFRYCLRVDSVNAPDEDDDREVWTCTRFGLDDDREQPVNDGAVAGGHLVVNPHALASGVWRRLGEPPYHGGPYYWCAMRPRGQQELFS